MKSEMFCCAFDKVRVFPEINKATFVIVFFDNNTSKYKVNKEVINMKININIKIIFIL